MKKIYALLVALFLVNGAIGQAKKPCVTCLPDGIIFTTQSQIDSFQINYPNCTEIVGNVTIGGDNPSNISNLNGLIVLTSIGGTLHIDNNQSLTSITGLDSLNAVGGNLNIGLSFWGVGNPVLNSLLGLSHLTSVAGTLNVALNPSLHSLVGLESLATIGCLSINQNDSLVSLMGLVNLTTVATPIDIRDNPSLTSLAGLDNIDAGSLPGILIQGNNQLSTCAVQSICDYLASPNANVTIENNATGCNSQQEVEDACAAIGVESLTPELSLTIYPNPTSSTITIDSPSTGSLLILNTSGQAILQREITEPTRTLDVSGFKSGVYVVKVVGEKCVQVGKFVKR
jgi:hypothetical protein